MNDNEYSVTLTLDQWQTVTAALADMAVQFVRLESAARHNGKPGMTELNHKLANEFISVMSAVGQQLPRGNTRVNWRDSLPEV